jgi:DNA topoisomerase-2
MPKLTRLIFHPHDDELLEYLEDDGLSIEPRYYIPILPMCLVNGADGIGTGWSTSVPNFNPRDIVESLRALIDGRIPPSLTPWYRGFVGTVSTADDRGSYSVYGVISKVDDVTIHISELPIRKWTQEYKEQVLEPLLQGSGGKGGGGEPILSELRENHTDTTVAFTLRFASAPALAKFEAAGLHKSLKLISHLGTTNMMLFDAQGRISRYESPEAVIRDFYLLRLTFYEKRKLHLAEKLEGERSKLSNRLRFVLAVIDGTFVIANRNRAQLIAALETAEYAKFRPPTRKPQTAGGAAAANAADDDDEEETSRAATGAERGYDYLLGMALWSLTAERVKSLRAELAAKEAELNSLLHTPPKQLWLNDLDAFETALASWEAEIAELGGKGKGKGGAAAKRPANAKRKAAADDLDWEASPPKKQIKKAAGSPARPIDLSSAVTIPVPAPEVKRQTHPAASESLLSHDRVRMPLRLAPLNPRDHDQYVELHHSCGVLRLNEAAFIPG